MSNLSRNAPRHINDSLWWYANDRSVDLVVSINNGPIVHLREKHLRAMLQDLRPARKRIRKSGGRRPTP